jgi:hypothetical protein
MGSPLDGDTDTEDINGESVQHEGIFVVVLVDVSSMCTTSVYVSFCKV